MNRASATTAVHIATRFANLTKSEDGGFGLRGKSLELLLFVAELGGISFWEYSWVSEDEDSLDECSVI